MSLKKPSFAFDVLLNDTLSAFVTGADINPIANKRLLSVINDFEDKKWRFTKFQNFVWDNIVETALSAEERENLIGNDHSRLTAAAKSLRLTDSDKDDIGRGSELAEIILYGVMKNHYGALPVVPKIFYKQNSQDNAKGSDSVHIVVNGSDFSLWLGEAKFYNEIEDARLDAIVDSVEKALQTDKLKKENSIVTNIRDLDALVLDKVLRNKIKDSLKPQSSIDGLKPKLHIPILLLHECALTKGTTELTEQYRNEIRKHHKQRAQSYFKKQAAKLATKISKYSEINFHLILLPVPSKEEIVKKFLSNVEHYKSQ